MPGFETRTEDSLANEAKQLAAKGEGCAIGRLLADLDITQRFDILKKTYTKSGDEVGPDHIKILPIENNSVTWGREHSMTVKRVNTEEWFAKPEIIYQESINFSTNTHTKTCK
jgi:hypothetical protein